jgi:Tol biopolymer transport system component
VNERATGEDRGSGTRSPVPGYGRRLHVAFDPRRIPVPASEGDQDPIPDRLTARPKGPGLTKGFTLSTIAERARRMTPTSSGPGAASTLPALRPAPQATWAVVFALGFLALAGSTEARNRSDLKWETLTTKHFKVHFHQGTEETARQAAEIAEEIYPAITRLYDFEPKTPTHLIIKDVDDYANGSAYYYDEKIEIWATALEFELRGTHTWLRDVITHEFTHIVSLQAAARFPHWMPAMYFQGFGYEEEKRRDVLIGYPNVVYSYPIPGTVASAWFAEGVAQYQTREVYNDWWDTHRSMLLRAAVLDSTLLTYDEMGSFGGNGLESEMVYNQGNSLVRYIATQYGEDALEQITRGLRSPWLIDMDSALEKATGKSGRELYQEWKAALEAEYGAVAAEIAKTAVPGHKVSNGGYLNLYPRWRPSTETLYWATNRGRDYGQLTLVKLSDAKLGASPANGKGSAGGSAAGPEPVESGISTPLTIARDGSRAFFSKRTDENPHGSRVNDVYSVDLAAKNPDDDRLTRNLRAKDPAISPDGSRVAAILNGDGTNQLVLIATQGADKGKVVKELSHKPHGTQFYTPSWSADGRTILLCTFRGLSRDIVRVDAETGAEDLLVDSPADERDPCFVPGENAILFASDRTGIFNLYRMDLETRATTQVTQVEGGTFYPAVSDSGTIAFSAYTGRGYEIRVLPRAEWGQLPVDPAEPDARGDYRLATAGPTALAFEPADEGFEGKATRYKLSYPATHIMPRFIIDDGRPRAGFYLSSNEILDQQGIFAGGALGRRHNGFEFELFGGYENRKLPVTIFAEGYRVRRRDVDVEDGQIVGGPGVPHSGQVRPINFEIRYDLVEGDFGGRYEWGEPYSLTYWKTAALYYTYQDYNINLFATDELDGSFYGKGGWSYYRGNQFTARFDYRTIERAIDSDINPRGGRTLAVRGAYNLAGLNPTGEVNIDTFEPQFTENHYGELEGEWREHMALPWGRHTLELKARGGWIENEEIDDFFWFAAGSEPGLRGYTYWSMQGRKLGIGSAAYRFPIVARLNREVAQITVHRIYAEMFYDVGNTWNGPGLVGLSTNRLRQDAGFELRFDTTSFYAFPAAFRVAGAYGFSEPEAEGWRWYSTLLFGF